jgi:hypothetical protein
MDTGLDAAFSGGAGAARLPGVAADSTEKETGLPGEHGPGIAVDPESRIEPAVAETRRRGRTILLASGVAAVALLASAGVAFSPWSPIPPNGSVGETIARAKAAFLALRPPVPMSPASRLARVPVPSETAPPVKPAPIVLSHDAEIDELRRLKAPAAGDAGAATPTLAAPATAPTAAAVAAAPPGQGPTEPAPGRPTVSEVGVGATMSAPATPQSGSPAELPGRTGITASPIPLMAPSLPEATTPPSPAPASVSPAAPVPSPATAAAKDPASVAPVPEQSPPESHPAAAPARPHDAAEQAASIEPAPMTDKQQLQVLGLVTEVGAMVRDLKAEIAALREDEDRLRAGTMDQLDDFRRRLILAEARWAVSVAMVGADHSLAEAGSPALVSGRRSRGSIESAGSTAKKAGAHQYHVEAAAPGLAMLREATPAGVRHHQLEVGDDVPGFGRVLKITQEGAAWVVVTEKGTIR